MMADYQEQVDALLEQTVGLADGPSKLALLEEAVRLADVHQDVVLGDEVRAELIRTAKFSGYPEKALVAFSWRLAQSDRDPEQFPEEDLLWEYKWIAGALPNFTQITRQQMDSTLDDMARRYERSGKSLRAIHKLRCSSAMTLCEPDAARQYARLWEKTPRDASSDCPACDQSHRVSLQLFLGKREKALQLAEPILRGSLRCAEIPHTTYALVLLPLLQTGQVEKAMEYHRTGYRLISGNRNFLAQIGEHLTFLALTDNLSRALKLFEKHLEWTVGMKDMRECWRFYLGVHLLMFSLAQSGQTVLKLRLPKNTPAYQEEGRYDVANLSTWIEETCLDLATRFDARNGNDGFMRRLAANRRLKRWWTPHPFRPARKADDAE